MSRRPSGVVGAAILALLIGVAGTVGLPVLAPTIAAEVAAAEPDLAVVANARYEIQPDRDRIHVVVDATAVNHRTDTATQRFFFENAFLAVPPGAAGFTVTAEGTSPSVKVQTSNRSYQIVAIDFGRRLYGQEELAFQLVFDLPDPGGEATRDVRVGQSLAAFPVWAYATNDTPGSRVTVVLPKDWSAEVHAGTLPEPVVASDGRTIYRTEPLDAPLEFYAYIVADRPGAYVDRTVAVSLAGADVPVIVRGWADDPEWSDRVAGLVQRGLPALADEIGQPFSGAGLVVRETVSRTLGGYAGLFDPSAATVEIAYFAGPFVTLHEIAHAWFNGRLVADRWISEAFASWYAHRAAEALDIVAPPPLLTPDLEAARIPLNAWKGVGRTDEEIEDYAYAATYRLAALIAERAGGPALQGVWNAAVRHESGYQPADAADAGAAATHLVQSQPDWRGLLDLLEAETGSDYTDLWRRWVIRPEEEALLQARATARAEYREVVDAAGPWLLPVSVRDAMAAWQFDQAMTLMGQVRDALDRRAAVEDAAAEAGLTVPAALQTAFEGPTGPLAMNDEADAELGAIRTIAAAQTASATRGPLEDLGLIGRDPRADLDRARTAFAAGDLGSAVALASAARAAWDGAAAIGGQRLILGTLMIGALLVLIAALIASTRAWRRGGGPRRFRALR